MKTGHWRVVLLWGVLTALCCYAIFVQVEETTTMRNNSGDDKIRAEIEAAFQKLLDAEDRHGLYRSVARIAAKAPDVIVHKFLTGDRETRRRALGVMYSFGEVGADTTLLVQSLVDAYWRTDQGTQIAILVVFAQAKAKPALPFLRQVLDDTRREPLPPHALSHPDRMCDTAYNVIIQILEDVKIPQGLKDPPRVSENKKILKMKQWLDSHPEVMKAAKSALEKLKSKSEK